MVPSTHNNKVIIMTKAHKNLTHIKRWTRYENYIGPDYSQYFVAYNRARDSELIYEANFETILERLGGESDTVKVVRFRHWAWGWVDAILVHEKALALLYDANEMRKSIEEDYPVLDEDRYDELVHDETMQMIEEIKKHPDGYGDVPSDSYELYDYAREWVLDS